MNDHAGWTKDGKCVLCGSSDSSKPCDAFKNDVNKSTGAQSILEAENERIISAMIAKGLGVEKEIEQYSGTLTKQMNDLDASVKQQMQTIKESIAKICEQKLQDHKCAGVVPGTFVVCGEDNYQYCSDTCLNIARHTKEIKKQTEDHPSDCGWWEDWHSCNCGKFDK